MATYTSIHNIVSYSAETRLNQSHDGREYFSNIPRYVGHNKKVTYGLASFVAKLYNDMTKGVL